MSTKRSTLLKILLLASIVFSISVYLSTKNKEGQPGQIFFGAKNLFPKKQIDNTKVEAIFKNEIPNLPGRWAIIVKDLKIGKIYSFNDQEVFPAASLYKLAVMWTAFDAIEKGILKKDEILSEDQITLDKLIAGNENFSSDNQTSATQKVVVSYTVENAIQAMITISDNYSALLLAQYLGWKNINDLMKSEGIGPIDLINEDAPTITASAAFTLLERIYRNTAVSPQASEEMKKILYAQQINDRIPKYLPTNVRVGHKTGELDRYRHDVGIVLGKKSHYIFIFLTDADKPGETSEVIATLSKRIFDALEGK